MLFEDYGFHKTRQRAKGKELRVKIHQELFAPTSLPFAFR
jgi:hypothetical protein